ncbi:homoserine kinase [Herbihabitans rhizosphaerae]|uniref:homoserine kinase n=1 Tax=Herbihabitans rhizosphaerae TaxID=1872711 RepID=UPI003BF89F28
MRVTVPASTANLGSGFDALGMALALHDVVEARVTDGGLSIEVTGEAPDSGRHGERHLVVKAFRAASRHLGATPPGLALRCVNAIPHSRGLGSSASALVAGVAAAYGLAGVPLDEHALRIAAGFEGHADNAAASLSGGLALAWAEGEEFHALRLDPHPDLRPVVLIPHERSATAVTRGLLPDTVPHTDAAFAAGRCALAVQAVTARPDLLLAATDDRLHQPYRESAWPATMALVRALRARGVAAAVSGAGPTVIAFPRAGELPSGLDTAGFEARELAVDRDGVRVEQA